MTKDLYTEARKLASDILEDWRTEKKDITKEFKSKFIDKGLESYFPIYNGIVCDILCWIASIPKFRNLKKTLLELSAEQERSRDYLRFSDKIVDFLVNKAIDKMIKEGIIHDTQEN